MNCSSPFPCINVENYYFCVPKVCAVKIINIVRRGRGKIDKEGAWKGFPKHFCTRLYMGLNISKSTNSKTIQILMLENWSHIVNVYQCQTGIN